MNEKKPIRFVFNTHGLGDCVHAATAMRLYLKAGYDVQIQVETNKQWIWEAAGIPIYDGPEKLPVHPYYYPPSFGDLGAPDYIASKIAHFFEIAELPKLGTKDEVWRMICEECVDASHAISQQARDEVSEFLQGLPSPVVLIHSKGTNWQERKSIPDGTAFELIRRLVNSFEGSVVTLDWDRRAPTLGHERVRSICPYWNHLPLECFAALCEQADLLIGVDSGPFHLASWLDIPTLYVAREIPPVCCCLPSARATYLVPAKDHEYWASRGPEWNLAEYHGPEATVQDIAVTAISILESQSEESITMQDIQAERIPGMYTYRRVGHDERPMELLPDSGIGVGSGRAERVWQIEKTPRGSVLTIYSELGGPTCHLTPTPDGAFRGRWLDHERMPIELVPMVASQAPLSPIPSALGHESDSRPSASPEFYLGILTYNRFDLLELALEAALRSTFLPAKIYIVDNSGGKWAGHPSRRIEVIRPPYNLGCARGFNLLQSICQPRLLIVGADDVEVGPDLFEKMLACPAPIVFGDGSQPFTLHLIRSEAWERIGQWDGKFYPAYHEDADYLVRAKLACVRTDCPESTGYKNNGPSATKAAMDATDLRILNDGWSAGRQRYLEKWGGSARMETFTTPFNGAKQS